MFKDMFGNDVQIGTKGVVLVHIYGYRKIQSSFLAKAKYVGKTQQGNHKFKLYECSMDNVSVRTPQFFIKDFYEEEE